MSDDEDDYEPPAPTPDSVTRGYAAQTQAAWDAKMAKEDREVQAYERWLERTGQL